MRSRSTHRRYEAIRARRLRASFPEGSLHGPTEAKPEIWDEWDEFVSLANRLRRVADGLVSAAENAPSGDGAMPSMGETTDIESMMGGRTMADMMGGGGPEMAMSADMLAYLPSDRVFAMLSDTCSACHTKFRVEKD
ncbi:MAG: hypothetical protein AcusKO_42580 [Acuticoccus sp.]